MLVLGIESTCDETACAVVRDGHEILSNVVASQADLHEVYGGVVPELACRRHVDLFIPVLDQALKEASIDLEAIDVIAVARGPGLIGALLIGINGAKALALATQKPIVPINHIEAHLYAALMGKKETSFPCLGVVVSGGHTSLIKMNGIGDYALIGQTVDDAIGEAFDKVAKVLELPYPGGPHVERLALNGDPDHYSLRSGRVKGRPLDFSFSGLKTAVLYAAKGQSAAVKGPLIITEEEKSHLAASFQKAAFQDIAKKVLIAAKTHDCKTIVFGGGVSNNKYLRQLIEKRAEGYQILWPDPALVLDNGAMIAGLGYHVYNQQGASSLDFEAQTRMPIERF